MRGTPTQPKLIQIAATHIGVPGSLQNNVLLFGLDESGVVYWTEEKERRFSNWTIVTAEGDVIPPVTQWKLASLEDELRYRKGIGNLAIGMLAGLGALTLLFNLIVK